MIKLFNKSTDYTEFYKKDNFIESFNYETNCLEIYKEDLLKIFTLFDSLKCSHGIEQIIDENGVFSKLFVDNLGGIINQSIFEDIIYNDGVKLSVLDNKLNIEVYLFIFPYTTLESYIIDNSNSTVTITSSQELFEAIDKYNSILNKALYEQFNLKYNEVDNKYYKVIYIGNKKKEDYLCDTQVFKTRYFDHKSQDYIRDFRDNFLKELKDKGIIKDYRITAIRCIEDKIDGFIELDDGFKIDLGSFNRNVDKDIWFIGTDKIDKKVIDFLITVYKYQINQTINKTKDKINYVLNFSTDKKNNFGHTNKHLNRRIEHNDNIIDKISMKSGLEHIVNSLPSNYEWVWDVNTRDMVDFLVHGKYDFKKNIPSVDNYIIIFKKYIEDKGLNVKDYFNYKQ